VKLTIPTATVTAPAVANTVILRIKFFLKGNPLSRSAAIG
jgi:hypothetical protein